MNAPRKSLMRKRASRLAAVQALYSEALIEKTTLPALLAAQLLQSWADSKLNDTDDLPHATQPEATLLNTIIEAAQTNHASIQAAIDTMILPGWTKARMSLPLLSVLHACAAEAIAYPERVRALLVDEYTEVAAQLVTDEELNYAHKAFNLLLDSVRPSEQ
ncbi:MAG: transcription antitermination factor NusB [Pseudomonadota bacterium]